MNQEKPASTMTLVEAEVDPRDAFVRTMRSTEEFLDKIGDFVQKEQERISLPAASKPPKFSENDTIEKFGPPPPFFDSWYETVAHMKSIFRAYDLSIRCKKDRKKFLSLVKTTVLSQGFLSVNGEVQKCFADQSIPPVEFKWGRHIAAWPLDLCESHNSTGVQPARLGRTDTILEPDMDHRVETIPTTGSIFNRTPLMWLNPTVLANSSAKTVLLFQIAESGKGMVSQI